MAGVSFQQISKVFPDGTKAVDELSLDVDHGEFMILVGPSGCGKTTALRMLAGLETVTAGELRIGDRVVNAVAPQDRDIAMVFQNYALYPHMSVFENMAFGLRMRKTPRTEIQERVDRIARILGLADLVKRRPAQLSGGQRQRVAMGRAIVRSPSAFLMDEPLSNLDARLRVQMRAEIARLQHDLGTTTIYVTHDQVEAMTMGTSVAVLRKGRLQQVDVPQALYDAPTNLFVASFIGSPPMNLVEATLERRPDGQLSARIGTQTIELPALGAGALEHHLGRPLALGIRPEHIGDPGRRSPDSAILTGRTILTEALGAERLVHIELDAAPVVTEEVLEVARDADATAAQELVTEAKLRRAAIIGRFETSFAPVPGSVLRFAIRPRGLHFFELETGRRIPATAAGP